MSGVHAVSESWPAFPPISPWCHSPWKRAFDLLSALLLLIPGLPLMLVVALLVKASSRGPILFCQKRLGENGREFSLVKFRTMRHRKHAGGPGVTRSGDLRITPVGGWLRQWKLDELPQLFHLLAGQMSLVGPRPDLADFFAGLPPAELAVLRLRPGITGWATLHFRFEEELLAQVPAAGLREFYVRQVLPVKIRLDLEYATRASFLADLRVLFATLSAIAR